MEYRITITLAGLGLPDVAEKNCERVLDAFQRTHPEYGPVTSADFRTGTLAITFALDAGSPGDAFEKGRPVFTDGMSASALRAEPVRLEIELVPSEELDEQPELQPA